MRTAHRSNQLLCRGLSVASSDRNHGSVERHARRVTHLLQSDKRVRNIDDRDMRWKYDGLRNDDAQRPRSNRLFNEAMTVKVLTTQRHE